MRAASLGLVMVLLMPMALAGCAGSASKEQAAPAAALPSKLAANHGTLLRVLVITDEYFPVPAARVTLVGLGVNGSTDEWGDAFFHLAKPGRYALHVHRAGFYPNQTRVVIQEGQLDATIRVRLSDAPDHSHYADFYFYNGLCGPTIYVKGVSESSDCTETHFFKKPQARFILGRGLVRGYLELSWDEHPGGAKEMRMEVRFPEVGAFKDGRETIVAEGSNPVRLTIPDELFTDKHRENGNIMLVNVGLSRAATVATNIQQDFQIDGEFSYYLEAPDVDPES